MKNLRNSELKSLLRYNAENLSSSKKLYNQKNLETISILLFADEIIDLSIYILKNATKLSKDLIFFLQKVNTKEIPIYLELIKNPMDLSSINKLTQYNNIYNYRIKTLGELACLWDQMWYNCLVFNQEGYSVRNSGISLMNLCEKIKKFFGLNFKNSSFLSFCERNGYQYFLNPDFNFKDNIELTLYDKYKIFADNKDFYKRFYRKNSKIYNFLLKKNESEHKSEYNVYSKYLKSIKDFKYLKQNINLKQNIKNYSIKNVKLILRKVIASELKKEYKFESIENEKCLEILTDFIFEKINFNLKNKIPNYK